MHVATYLIRYFLQDLFLKVASIYRGRILDELDYFTLATSAHVVPEDSIAAIQLLHVAEISMTDTDDDNGAGELRKLHNKLLCSRQVMNGAICKYQQDLVLLLSLQGFNVTHELLEERSKHGRSSHYNLLECATIGREHVLDTVYFRVHRITIDSKTVIDLCYIKMARDAAEAKNWNALLLLFLIVVVLNLNGATHFMKDPLVVVELAEHRVVRFLGIWITVASSEVYGSDERHDPAALQVVDNRRVWIECKRLQSKLGASLSSDDL